MEYAVVLLLVLSPVEPPWQCIPRQVSPQWWKALKDTAKAMDLVDAKTPWIQNFRSEARWVRSKRILVRYCPPSSDIARMPGSEECAVMIKLIDGTMKWLDRVGETRLHHYDETVLLRKQLIPYQEWWEVARSLHYDVALTDKREVLKKLRDTIGEEDYKQGNWPYPLVSP